MPYKDPAVQREYQRVRCAATRAEFFKDKKCVECGSTERMELDHIDPALKTSHKIWSWAPARRLAEITKCQVLCHACHLVKTIASYEPSHHGCAVRRKKCKCGLCRLVHRNAMRAFRARNGSIAELA